MNNSDYKPIADYGVVGNCRSVALVGKDGSVDWCCFPHLDGPSQFAAILDKKKGGRFSVSIDNVERTEQFYRGDSNVLETVLRGQNGEITINDFMPMSGDLNGKGRSQAEPELHRVISCVEGNEPVLVEWAPRFDYARAKMEIYKDNQVWVARGGSEVMCFWGIENGEIVYDEFGPLLKANIKIVKGERISIGCCYGSDQKSYALEDTLNFLDQTIRIWESWAHREGVVHNEDWAGRWYLMVVRSELVLKMLSHADTGAIAAALTTSLPELIGGVRNWDYRYAWIRDASITAQALVAVGHPAEGIQFIEWLEEMAAEQLSRLQVMYGIHGRTDMQETILSHLEGYRSSRPVRVGNAAASQLQLETYGELISMGYELARRGHRLKPQIWIFLQKIADYISEIWIRPDHGIWEERGEPRHFTYSKVMCWVALDRAVRLANEFGMEGDSERWVQTALKIHKQVLEHGFNREIGSFTAAFDSTELDAATLRLPILEFLPPDDKRVQGTINHIMERLFKNGLVYRYRFDDGLPGEEGAFGLCTFWLVDALALCGRLDEAHRIMEKIVLRANHLGLFSEEFDPGTGDLLGNFPQAFTHVGLINSTLYLAYAEGRPIPEHALIGTPEHRRTMGRKF